MHSLSGWAQSSQESKKKRVDALSNNHPVEIPGLLTFWDFQEASGTDRISVGKYKYALKEMNGPIIRANEGVFGPYSADFEWGQWLRVKRKDGEALNLHGDDQTLTMVAWIKRESDLKWQYIAGIWDEGHEEFVGKVSGSGKGAPCRQYGIFISGTKQTDYTTYERSKAEHQIMGYISPYGGATPDRPFAYDYATGGTQLELERWYMIAYTFDGEVIKVYLDGELDENRNCNPFYYDGPIHDGGENGADFTVAQRNHPSWPTYPAGVLTNKEGFDGLLGGLAVYDRALTSEEILKLYVSSMNK